jgi:predicted aconitase with swiveling domain
MSAMEKIIVRRSFGKTVEGEAIVSEEGFSPRYDLDRWSGIISRPGHKLEGLSIAGKILFFPSAKGGIAAGWAFYDIKHKGFAPKAFIFGVTNPVMVQGALFADIAITEGWDRNPVDVLRTGDIVRVSPEKKCVELLRRPG